MTEERLQQEKQGKIVDWRGKKRKSSLLADSFGRLGLEKKQERCANCGSILEFLEKTDGTLSLKRGNFCRERLCPMCEWRKSLKYCGQTGKIMCYLSDKHSYRYILLTLTVRNCSDDGLAKSIDLIQESFTRLTKTKEFKKSAKGFFRGLEVTRDEKKLFSDRCHPHIHVVLAVSPSYFSKSEIYLTQNRWVALWRECLGVDYDPVLDVRVMTPSEDGKYIKTVAEVAKYVIKPSEYICEQLNLSELARNEKTDKAVLVMTNALKGRRLFAYGGCFREAARILKLEDVEKSKYDDDDEAVKQLDEAVRIFRWNPCMKDYFYIKPRKGA